MMRLKVVDNYTYNRVEVVEVDTVDNLKAEIMKCFSLTEDDLKERLLVRDGRVKPVTGFSTVMPMVNGFDLLDLKEGSILKENFCSECLDDGDTLLLGWKGPFIVGLVSEDSSDSSDSSDSDDSKKIVVNHDDTLGHLKKEIARLTGVDVTIENLPTILYKGDDSKPLIFFGFYNYYKGPKKMVEFYIARNSENDLVSRREKAYGPSYSTFRAVPEMPRYCGKREYDINERGKDLKVIMMDQNGERILIPLPELYNQKKMNKGMEDKEDAGPPYKYKLYQLSKKESEKDTSMPDDDYMT